MVLSDAKSLNGKVSSLDRDKLDEYFQSIREVELGLVKDAQWAEKPKPKADRKAPGEGIEGEVEILLTYLIIWGQGFCFFLSKLPNCSFLFLSIRSR